MTHHYPKNIYSCDNNEPAPIKMVDYLKMKSELDYYKSLSRENFDLYSRLAEDCVRGNYFGKYSLTSS